MANNKRKQRKNQRNNKKRKLSSKTQTLEIETESESDRIQKLLEPYSKDQLIDFLSTAAVNDSSLFEKIKSTADKDVSHRKIFIHGLSWETTRETLYSAFQSYGEIEECKLVTDRVTGKARGYGFVLFKSRIGAKKALKDPQKRICNRVATCQLASIGPTVQQKKKNDVDDDGDKYWRKIYVSNVHVDANREKLRTFFEKFGEIEMGPLGFDNVSGKSRGFAIFVYKSLEGAKKALAEPYKMFEGHQLHCQRVSEDKNKAVVTQEEQRQQPPAAASVSAAQNLGLFHLYPSLNPMYSGLVGNSNPGFISGSVNPASGTLIPGSYEGHQLHSQTVSENKNKPANKPATQEEQRQQTTKPSSSASVPAQQNLAVFPQHPSLNPMYSGLVGNPNSGLILGGVNPFVLGTLSPGFFPSTQMGGAGLFGGGFGGGYSGILGGGHSLPGPHASMNPALHEFQTYQNSHLGQPPASRIHGASGPLTGYQSYFR